MQNVKNHGGKMQNKKQDVIDESLQALNDDGVDRRGFLKCMAWAGTGLVWTMSGGIPVSRAFAKNGGKDRKRGDFSFVQISDSHIGFNKPANPDVTITLQTAINKINAGSSQTRVIDAVDHGVYMLKKRPKNNRKIILVVSETRDEGSETKLKEALIDVNIENVQVYFVDISQLAVRLTEKPDIRPEYIDPTTMNAPLGIPNTPTTAQQNYGMENRVQFIPLFKEIFIDTKAIFVKDPAKQFSVASGGAQFTFLRQKGLEEAIQKISEELHSQYMISYAPTNGAEGGYHTIEVSIERTNLICKTRPGYYIGGGAQ